MRRRLSDTPTWRLALLEAAFVGNGKLLAALFTAASQNFTAVFRFHAVAETVFVLAGAAGWLVGTFHRYFEIKIFCFKNWSAKVGLGFEKSSTVFAKIRGEDRIFSDKAMKNVPVIFLPSKFCPVQDILLG